MTKWIFALIAAFIVSACNPNEGAARNGFLTDSLTIVTVSGDKHKFDVELALSDAQYAQGLMRRTQMDDMSGMLFWFGGAESERSFWMKNTLLPLDILFIKKDGTIHHIHHNAQPLDLSPAPSQGAVAAVLEINAGMAKKLGISSGDTIKQRFFK